MPLSKSTGDVLSAAEVNSLAKLDTADEAFTAGLSVTKSTNNEPALEVEHTGTHSDQLNASVNIEGSANDNTGIHLDDGTVQALISIVAGETGLTFRVGDGGGSKTNQLSLFETGAVFPAEVFMTGLPTSDPAQAGRLWSDGGTLKVSAG